MASQQKTDTNRAIALKSTGPKTTTGKAARRSAAFKRGIRSRTVVMPGEDRDQYNQLYNRLSSEYLSLTPHEHEQFLIRQMTDAQWRLGRLKGIETALLEEDEINVAEIDRISRWQTRLENIYCKAYNELKSLKPVTRKARANDELAHDDPPLKMTIN